MLTINPNILQMYQLIRIPSVSQQISTYALLGKGFAFEGVGTNNSRPGYPNHALGSNKLHVLDSYEYLSI